jgi:hypothetical protein
MSFLLNFSDWISSEEDWRPAALLRDFVARAIREHRWFDPDFHLFQDNFRLDAWLARTQLHQRKMPE